MKLFYLVSPNGSRLFQLPYPEEFCYHCLLLIIDTPLEYRLVAAPCLVQGALFFCCLKNGTVKASVALQAESLFPVSIEKP